MTKAVLEAENEGAGRRTMAAVPSPALAVPASLHASLMARLDRLGPAKEVAQIGSVIGREFSHALLASVAVKSEAELGSALDRLIQAGLLFRQGAPPQASYLFKHALVRERAPIARCCGSLGARFTPVSPKALSANSADRLRASGVLARHCTEAGLIEKGRGYGARRDGFRRPLGADRSQQKQLTRALEQIATLPATPALRREQIKLQVALLNPLIAHC